MKPFTTIEQVESFFSHSIYKCGKEMTVVGASYNDNTLYIHAVDKDNHELAMPAINWFYSAKYMGHRFGVNI